METETEKTTTTAAARPAEATRTDLSGVGKAITEEQNSESLRKLELLCAAADEMKAHAITILDVRGQTIVADYFVICTGTSVTHIRAIGEGVQERLREQASLRAKPEGDALSFWMILDYSEIILHIFDEETREFYDLERLWSDAKVARWEEGQMRPVADEDSADEDAENEIAVFATTDNAD